MDEVYLLIVLLSAVVVAVQAFSLLGGHIPDVPEMVKYRTSRRILAISYLLLALPGFIELLFQDSAANVQSVEILTLITASFQALLFTFSLITLIQPDYVTWKRIGFHLIIPLFILVVLLPMLLSGQYSLFNLLFYAMLLVYALQLVGYTWLFKRRFKRYLFQMDAYYAEEDGRFRWIRQSFYMALFIGIMALISVFLSKLYYIVFTCGYTCFYVFFAIKYANYVTLFQYSIPALRYDENVLTAENEEADDEVKESPCLVLERESRLAEKIDEWIQQKKYLENGRSLDDIAISLGTNRSYLSKYLNERMNINFKLWRTQLRIEEAQRILIEHPDVPIVQVGAMIGMEDRTNFHHRFRSVTGVTPVEWRKQMGVKSAEKIEYERN